MSTNISKQKHKDLFDKIKEINNFIDAAAQNLPAANSNKLGAVIPYPR